jgi:hypothetical protein
MWQNSRRYSISQSKSPSDDDVSTCRGGGCLRPGSFPRHSEMLGTASEKRMDPWGWWKIGRHASKKVRVCCVCPPNSRPRHNR